MRLPLGKVKIGKRRRSDLGDIGELAESLRRFGLLHPIVVDDTGRLVAGERRLQAATLLGWADIEARSVGELTDAELRELELEENLRRKDLTALERSRKLVELAEAAAEVDKNDSRTTVGRKSSGGQPKPGSERRVAERIGQPRETIERAKAHVAAVSRYPELTRIGGTQKDVLTIARNLDKLDQDERDQARSRLMNGHSDTLTTLAEKPPMPKVIERAKDAPSVKWAHIVYEIAKLVNSIGKLGGIAALTADWPERAPEAFVHEIDCLIADLEQIKATAREEAA